MSRLPRRLSHAVLLISAALALAMPGAAHARRTKDAAKLNALSKQLTASWEARRGARFQELLNSSDPRIRALNEGPNARLQYIDDDGRPVYHGNNDLISAQTVSTDEVWAGGAAGFALDGDRFGLAYLAIWEAVGEPRQTHQEFGNRIASMEPMAEHFHATRVAGILLASGVNANAIGMSPDAEVMAFLSDNDAAEMALWASANLTVSSHSYSPLIGWNQSSGTWTWYGDVSVSSSEDDAFGKYSDAAQEWDQVAYDAPDYVIVGGAGNDRNDFGPVAGTSHLHLSNGSWVNSTDSHAADGGTTGYDTMPSTKCAKNIITVGGINDIPGGWGSVSDAQTTTFSSWGPTDDGRIKPDVVANAFNLTAPDSGADNAYTTTASGCSYAGPAVAGSVNLILQQWEIKKGTSADPLSSTVKAILVHTADEAGTTGPDYIYGWGVVDTREAVELVDADGPVLTSDRILEPTLDEDATDTFEFWWDGEAPFSVTMAWTDPAGTPPGSGVDIATAMLVNDLDLRVQHLLSLQTWEPWVLNPAVPAAAATTGDNVVDNVEQVHVEDPPAGFYRATVTHKRNLDSGSQDYSLILPAPKHICLQAVPIDPGTWLDLYPGWQHHWAHFDTDSRPDITLIDPQGHIRGFHNRGGGIFSGIDLSGLEDIAALREAAWADFDGDGDQDCFVGGDGTANRLYRNNGQGSFTNIWPDGAATTVLDAVWVDSNVDGRLDLYVSRLGQGNRLYRNNGGGSFTDVTPPALAYIGETRQAAWANIDADAWPEVFLANSDGPGRLFDTNGSAYQQIALPDPGSSNYGAAWADVDDDGDWDLYVANDNAPDRLLLRTPAGFVAANLPDLGPDNGGRPGVIFGDLDLDGDQDVALPHHGLRLRNDGNGVFTPGNALPATTSPFLSASFADLELDGHLDTFLGHGLGSILERGDPCNEPSWHWVELELESDLSNRDALGAIVTVQAGGRTQRRQMGTGSGANAEGARQLHFGLGPAAHIDLLRIQWPSGAVVELANLGVDRLLRVTESPTSTAAPVSQIGAPPGSSLVAMLPNPFRASTVVRFQMTSPGPARLGIYSVDGRLVQTLADGHFDAGMHEVAWDGRDASGASLARGVYYVRMVAGQAVSSDRLVYLK